MTPVAPPPEICFSKLSLRFPGGVEALHEIDVALSAGEVLTVLGPSGCGKTTLLRLVAGLIRPSAGRVEVKGRAPVIGADSALVFQNFRLLPWKTVAENVAFPLSHLPKAERAARTARVLETVGLSRFAQSHPRALSGGMQQRVALARALAADPDILLMDEPFASLDAQSRELMQAEVARLVREPTRPRTVIFVTHSVDEALMLGDRVLLMAPRPGRVARLIDLPFARQKAPRHHPEFAPLREALWGELRAMVLSDPHSDFYGRGPSESDE